MSTEHGLKDEDQMPSLTVKVKYFFLWGPLRMQAWTDLIIDVYALIMLSARIISFFVKSVEVKLKTL